MFTQGCIKSNRFLVDDLYEYYNDVDVDENVYDYFSSIDESFIPVVMQSESYIPPKWKIRREKLEKRCKTSSQRLNIKKYCHRWRNIHCPSILKKSIRKWNYICKGIFTGCSRCGVRRGMEDDKIVGGQTARSGAYPWMVWILTRFDTSGSEDWTYIGSCGGSVINSKWIITAQHCLALDKITFMGVVPVDEVKVYLGLHEILNPNPTGLNKRFSVSKIIEAPDNKDLALIKVVGEIDISIYTPVCLPSASDTFFGMNSVAIGWGVNTSTTNDDPNAALAEVLQELTMPIQKEDFCNNYINSLGTPPSFKWPENLCIGDGEADRGTCYGDSGGPFIVQKLGERRWTLAGLVSFGTSVCSSEDSYSVAMNIAHFHNFISTNVNDGEFCDM